MKHKKGAIGFVISVIIAVFLVGAVAYITLHSIGASVTSILEPLKKLVGIETNKAEASTTKTGECTVKRYYWQPNKARFGEEVGIVIEGSDSCDGKSIKLNVYTDLRYGATDPKEEYLPSPVFKGNKIVAKWYIPNRKYTFGFKGHYFIYEFGNDKRRSENLEVVS